MKHEKYAISNLPPIVYIKPDNEYQYNTIVSMLTPNREVWGTLIGFQQSDDFCIVINSEQNSFWDSKTYTSHHWLIHARDFIDSNTELLPSGYSELLAFPAPIESDMCYFLSVDTAGVKLAEVCLNKTKETYKLVLTSAYLIVRGDLVEVYNQKNVKVKVYPREKCIIK